MRRVHPGWLTLAGASGAFAVFEVVKHLGWTIPGAAVGALLPFVGVLGEPVRRVVLHPVPPLVVLVAFTVLPETNTQAAPGFTLGLAWLTHVAVARALRPSPA